MAQKAKPIDLTRTYLPIDPNMLTETMHGTEAEDRPEERVPVVPYEGWNFMPTAYGYRSYFGTTSKLEINDFPYPSKVRDVFTFQKSDLSNIIILLADNGIWTKSGETTGDWVQEVTLTEPEEGVVQEWSKCIIANILYIYRQQNDVVYSYESPNYTFVENTPSTLNMEGQLGIFKAGSRLGMWDSDNAVAWSSFEDLFDFDPSIATSANITSIIALVGKIINIVQHGDGFIIYGTKSIIGIAKDLTQTFLWNSEAIGGIAGIAFRNQVAMGSPDTIHFAYTSLGLMRIENFKPQIVTPELYDFLKESQDPIYLKLLEGRYLAVQLSNEGYVDGLISFYTQTINDQEFLLSEVTDAVVEIPDYTVVVEWPDAADMQAVWQAFDRFPGHSVQLLDHGGCSAPADFCLGVDYGVYEDHILIPCSPGNDLTNLSSGEVAARTRFPFTINGKTNYLAATESPINSNAEDGVTPEFTAQVSSPNEGDFYRRVTALYDKHNTWALNTVAELDKILSRYSLGENVINSAYTVTPLALPIGARGPAFSNTIALIQGVMPSTAGPLNATASNDTGIRYFYDFWLDYGRVGELFYVNAYPLKSTAFELVFDKRTASYRYPFTVQITSVTTVSMGALISAYNTIIASLGATLPQFNASGSCIVNNDTELASILAALTTKPLFVGGVPLLDITLASSPATYSYCNLSETVSSTNTAGLTLDTPITGPSLIGYGPSIQIHYTDNTPSDYYWTIQIFSSGLVSSDQLVYTKTVRENNQPCDGEAGDLYFASWSYPTSYIRYNADGSTSPSPNSPPPLAMSDSGLDFAILPTALQNHVCHQYSDGSRGHPTFLNMTMPSIPADWDSNYAFTLEDTSFTLELPGSAEFFILPGTSFLMQTGAPVPFDILWQGAYIYDTHLKRWGKYKGEFRQLLDFSPLNSTALGTIPVTNFGLQAAVFNNDGEIRLFDTSPSDSYIKFGKIGDYRAGFTSLEELRADFRRSCSGELEIEASIDGRSVEAFLTQTRNYEGTKQVLEGFDLSAKWYNVSFKGEFDLTYLEYRSWIISRR